MIRTHDREKMIHAIIFFLKNTRKCGKTKLFKLLYFLDFEHYKKTGRSVTGLDYHAWPMGPVPVSLFQEFEQPSDELKTAIDFQEKILKDGERKMLTMKPLIGFSSKNFTKRELELMRTLAVEYLNSDAENMIEATHLENLPWHKIYNEQGARQAEIPYRLAIRSDERDAVMRVANDRKELLEKLK